RSIEEATGMLVPTLLSGILAIAGNGAEAVRSADPPPVPPRPCASPEFRQFDFWIGEWNVTTPDGQAGGHNRSAPSLGGCALRESWTGASGTHGTSLNAFDPGARVWRQTWVDDGGTVLLISGRLDGGQMILEGEVPAAGGKTTRQRIRWTPLSEG